METLFPIPATDFSKNNTAALLFNADSTIFKPMLCVDAGVQSLWLLGYDTASCGKPSGPDGPGLGLALTQLVDFKTYTWWGSRIRQLLRMTFYNLYTGQVHPDDLKEQKPQADS